MCFVSCKELLESAFKMPHIPRCECDLRTSYVQEPWGNVCMVTRIILGRLFGEVSVPSGIQLAVFSMSYNIVIFINL